MGRGYQSFSLCNSPAAGLLWKLVQDEVRVQMRREMVDEQEIVEMAAEWGTPMRFHAKLVVGPDFWMPWEGKWHTRRGEVMFLLPRPGGLLLHRKAHYPEDVFRLLTGGIELEEGVRETIVREPLEEVGLELPVRRYVAVVSYEVECEGQSFPWATHIFMLPFSDAPLQPSHDDEIAETVIVALDGLVAVAEHLESLPAPWNDWGRFRAVAHRVVAQQVDAEELNH
jgi:ADP-ribose pyrophosphatase YjhB (NUDIX family)